MVPHVLRLGSRSKATDMKRWIALLVLVFLPAFTQAKTTNVYRYAYITSVIDTETTPSKADFHDTLNLIDPSNLSSPPITLALPNRVEICGDASPDGRWLIVCYSPPGGSGTVDWMLLDMQTGALQKIETTLFADDKITTVFDPEWSDDSRYLVLNEYSLSLGTAGISLYDVNARKLTMLVQNGDNLVYPGMVDIGRFYQWMPASHLGVFQKQLCTKPDFYTALQCNALMLELRKLPEMTLLASIEAPGYGWDICNLSGSPGGRYLAFEAFCDPFGDNPAFRELYVWDTLQNKIEQLTSNTDPNIDTWYAYPHKYASYKPLWYDRQTLMLGVRSEMLIYDNGFQTQEGSVFARTELYRFDHHDAIIIMDDDVRFWAKNPVNSVIAFQNEVYSPNTDHPGQSVLTLNRVSLATFDGQSLTVTAQVAGGCRGFKWSPDGTFLAYPVLRADAVSTFCNSQNTERFRFVTGDGHTQDFMLPLQDYYKELGWLQVPNTSIPATAYFPAGTPTPIPTRGGYG